MKLKNLEQFSCIETDMSNEECKVIAHCCPQLTTLSLMNNPRVSARGLKHLATKQRKITKLNIVSTGTRKDFAKLLKNPKVFPKLRILRVSAEILTPCEEALSNRFDFVVVTTSTH